MSEELEELLEAEQQEQNATRSDLRYCEYCGMGYTSKKEDIEAHEKFHARKILAESKFGHIAPYSEREYVKSLVFKMGTDVKKEGGEDLQLYAWWSRSVEACKYDLRHPTLSEYKFLYRTHSHVMNGSYVNMKKYKYALDITE